MTMATVDRLVIQDDAAAARLWPRLGPKVRDAYLADRDGWIALRRKADAGTAPSAEELAAKHRAFAGWARAFHAAAVGNKHPATERAPQRSARHAPSSRPANPSKPTSLTTQPTAPAVALASTATSKLPAASGGATSAVAGGLVLAGLIAFAARRKGA